jgi:hypothetical protein
MPKMPVTLLLFLLLLTSPGTTWGELPANECVRVEVQPVPAALHPGASWEVEIRFFPADGIHINTDPPVQFTLDSMGVVSIHGKPLMIKDSKSGYLSTADPVKQSIEIRKNASPGKLTVKGTITYFFCSDTEGWCNRQKEHVEFTILVKP